MADIKWASDVSGRFSVAADWTGGVVPGATATAELEASGAKAYTVTSNLNETVDLIDTDATATLSVTAGTFTASGGVNTGTITLTHSAVLDLGGAWSGTGEVNIGAAAALTIATRGLSLSGTGGLNLEGGKIEGSSATTKLVNAGPISGFGALGDGELSLVNKAGATLSSSGSGLLTIDTGSVAVSNAGTILAGGTGGVTITGAVTNSGLLEVEGSKLTVDGAVAGAGTCEIVDGTADFASTFKQDVTFLSAEGTLELADSLTYTGSVSGFSQISSSIEDVLDLADIAFVTGKTKAVFNGTAEGGVLVVTNGTSTARIKFIGNYVGNTFTASAGIGGIGTQVVLDPESDSPASSGLSGPSLPVHAMVQAMATVSGTSHAPGTATLDFAHSASPALALPMTQRA